MPRIHSRKEGDGTRRGSFPILYLNRDLLTSRANLDRKFAGRPYGPEMLNPDEASVLVQTNVDDTDFVDAVTDEGCVDLRLPQTYLSMRKGTKWDGIGANPLGWRRGKPVRRGSPVVVPRRQIAAEKSLPCSVALEIDRSG